MTVALRYAARSDVGLVRSNNQDSAYAGPHLLVVADGMGGHAGGDIASSVAVAHLAPLDDEAHGPDDALEELSRALSEAHDDLLARAEENPELAGLGTTVTALLRAGNKLAMAHIGDSRAYLLRAGELTQVTTDHSFVQHLVNTGKITPEEAEHHPHRSVLLRVLGDFDMELLPDVSVREARAGDRWLLCSDGLSGVVSRDTIAETLAEIADVGACADQLVQLALRGGAPDNVTVVVSDVVDVDDLPDGAAPPTGSQVVGSAATDRHRPTRGGAGAAARAAEHAAASRPPVEPLDEDEPPPRRTLRRIVWSVVVVLVLAGLGAAGRWGWVWTQDQYYVGVADGYVAIYQGIDQNVGPLELSHVVEKSPLRLTDLPGYMQDRVNQTVQLPTLAAAEKWVADREHEAVVP
ncbi:protein phosphatase 2C domain-containing protein [Isoptericola sp. b441]|uniref:Protein phosphatase 2C domain-containing protein n=1 Tax=Actinotalea lenta TaxID=3064654 RepID=A0ABT9D5S7_9CELL|nr:MULTISPECIES: PP2C family serine/threonine-protein phosphatase [unclassified Isoptericola]MDO8106158.1 protein phosphatase 2C domain-containing protein [Isoptericola sp. b441]MDO8122123.1 protein phosphatase 2C domain-containing protein [Isoptericola sp. b490]